MHQALPALPAAIAAFAASALSLSAQELSRNGNFEAGRLPPWSVEQVSGSTVALAAESSPFTAQYPAGVSSVRINDDDADFEKPSLSQDFEPQPGIAFAFDFKVRSISEQPAPWYLAWQGEDETTAFFFSIGGQDGVSIEFNQERIATLKPNTWYHVEGWADAPRQLVRGSINALGEPSTEFQGGFPFGVKSVLNAIELSDGDAAPNASIHFDNFSTRAIALEITRNPSGEIVVSWPFTDFHLEAASTLSPVPDWTIIPGATGTYTNTSPAEMRFFRLAQ